MQFLYVLKFLYGLCPNISICPSNFYFRHSSWEDGAERTRAGIEETCSQAAACKARHLLEGGASSAKTRNFRAYVRKLLGSHHLPVFALGWPTRWCQGWPAHPFLPVPCSGQCLLFEHCCAHPACSTGPPEIVTNVTYHDRLQFTPCGYDGQGRYSCCRQG